MMHRFSLASVVVFLLASFGSAVSQDRSTYDQALEALLEAPSDAELSFAFAQAAVAASEPRPAIAALERILVFDPTLANIRLELGGLYLSVGATQLAERRLSEAIASPDAPPEVKARAEQLLETSQVANETLRITGSVYVGARGESNPAAAPGSSSVQIVVGGQEVAAQLDSASAPEPDVSVFGLATTKLDYDLGYQRDHRFVTDLTYYGTRHLEERDVDLDAFSIVLGPDLKLTDTNDISVRPYIVGTYVREARTDFLRTGGIGAEYSQRIDETLRLRGNATVQWQDFIESPRSPTNNNRDGLVTSVRPTLDWTPSPSRRISGGLELRYSGADARFERFFDIGPFASVTQLIPSPIDASAAPWIVSFFAGYRYRPYDAPDPVISLTESQRDHRTDLRLTLQTPVFDQAVLVTELGYARNFSNYDIDAYENIFGSFGLEYQF